jgi:hypothetical protein
MYNFVYEEYLDEFPLHVFNITPTSFLGLLLPSQLLFLFIFPNLISIAIFGGRSGSFSNIFYVLSTVPLQNDNNNNNNNNKFFC